MKESRATKRKGQTLRKQGTQSYRDYGSMVLMTYCQPVAVFRTAFSLYAHSLFEMGCQRSGGQGMESHDDDSRIGLGQDCYLDLDGEVLMKDGGTQYLTPIAFRLLRYLAEHLGEVLTSEDLIRRAWGKNGMVPRDELYVYIRKIRLELEDDPDEPQCLKTVRHRGYVLYARQKEKSPCGAP